MAIQEIERRVILFKSTTTLPDDSQLGWNADPNTVVNGNTPGETLLYNCPLGTQYIENDGTHWRKTTMPNTWTESGSGGGGSGDVDGPASAVSDNIATFNGTTGKLIKDSGSKASDFATSGHNHSGIYEPLKGEDDNYVTDVEKGNLHAPGSDDQDLSNYATKAWDTSGHSKGTTAKTELVDDDLIPIFDSEDSYLPKYITFANLVICLGTVPSSGTPYNFQDGTIFNFQDGTAFNFN